MADWSSVAGDKSPSNLVEMKSFCLSIRDGDERPPHFVAGQSESERVSRLAARNLPDSQAFAFSGQRERREPVPPIATKNGSQAAPHAEQLLRRVTSFRSVQFGRA